MAKLTGKFKSVISFVPVHIRQVCLCFSRAITNTYAPDFLFIAYWISIDEHLCCVLSQRIPAANMQCRERGRRVFFDTLIID